MLYGKFGEKTGRLYIPGFVYIPRLAVNGVIQFIMDTGADNTTLMPADSIALSVDFDALSDTRGSRGIGGTIDLFEVQSHVAFRDHTGTVYSYRIDMLIYPSNGDDQSMPSLLGRDVMDHWRVIYDRTNNELSADVLTWHQEFSF